MTDATTLTEARLNACSKRRLMMIELNELEPGFLRAASERLGLQNIATILRFPHSTTTTEERVEHHGLDPWTQWVSVHTGIPASAHGVRRLGSTRGQPVQIWNKVASAGKSWGVWGAMNAPLGNRAGCQFFMPDPWSWDEDAYPSDMADILALPRYISKNYLDIDRGSAAALTLRFARFLVRQRTHRVTLPFIKAASFATARTGINVHTMSTLLDYLSTLLFIDLRRKYEPDFSVIFLNHIAHAQHHFWNGTGAMHPQMQLALRTCDAVLGELLLDKRQDESVLTVNAFRQKNVSGQGFICYRQRNPAAALRQLGVDALRVEPCMTNEAHVFFDSATSADRAQTTLQNTCISDGQRAFYVERTGATSIFYQVDFDRIIPDGATIVTPRGQIEFSSVFEFVTARTGAHVSEGDVYALDIDVPARLANHDIHDVIVKFFSKDAAEEQRPAGVQQGG